MARTRTTDVLVCGDQALYRAALSCLIHRDARLRVVAESANDAATIRRAMAGNAVDLVVIDYDVVPPHTIEHLEELLGCVSSQPVLVIASHLDADACQRIVRRGASGVVFKSSDGGVLLAAIDSARRGQVWLDRTLLPKMFDDSQVRLDVAVKSTLDRLTRREREVMTVACTGITNKEIASRLSISEATVRHHLGSIFTKLGVSTRSELVAFGYRNNVAVSAS